MATVNINSASAEEIAEVCPMLGKEKAEAIVRVRERRGPFKNARDLRRVPGFSFKLSEGLVDFINFDEPPKKEEVVVSK